MASWEVQLLLASVKLNTLTLIPRGLAPTPVATVTLALSISSRVTARHRTISLTRKCMQISTEGPLALTITSYITKSFKTPQVIVPRVTLRRIVTVERCSLKVRECTRLSTLVPMRQLIFLLARIMWRQLRKPRGIHTRRSLKR
jgi:hypothetical protein